MPAELRTTSELQELPTIRAFLQSQLHEMAQPPLPIAVIDAVQLATVEAVTNIIKYAYADATERALRIRLQQQDGHVRVTLLHHGDSTVPVQVEIPDFSGAREDGFGRYIMHALMDEVTVGQEAPDWQARVLIKKVIKEVTVDATY